MPGFDDLAQLIAKRENAPPGRNNPGNLRSGLGQIDSDNGFAVFPDQRTGWEALHHQISLDAGRGLTLGQFINKYAPPSENDTGSYLAYVKNQLGVDENTPLSSIGAGKPERIVNFEGRVIHFPGDATDDEIREALSGPPVPPDQNSAAYQRRHGGAYTLKHGGTNYPPGSPEAQMNDLLLPITTSVAAGPVLGESASNIKAQLPGSPLRIPETVSSGLPEMGPITKFLADKIPFLSGAYAVARKYVGPQRSIVPIEPPSGLTMPRPQYPFTPQENPTGAPPLEPLPAYGEPGMPQFRVPFYNRNFQFIRDIRANPMPQVEGDTSSIPSVLPSGRIPGVPTSATHPPEPVLPRTPLWQGLNPVGHGESPPIEPIYEPLPSGRIPGVPRSALGHSTQTPIHINPEPIPPEGIQPVAQPAASPRITPVGTLSSKVDAAVAAKRLTSPADIFDVMDIARDVGEPIEAVKSHLSSQGFTYYQSPEGFQRYSEAFKKGQITPIQPGQTTPMQPITTPARNPGGNPWVRANDALHSTIQEMSLPGSPAGQKAAGWLSNYAKSVGKASARELSPNDLDTINEFIVNAKRFPKPGEIQH